MQYLEMCRAEETSLQRGMNFRLRGNYSVVLMSTRHGAPYADRLEDDGQVLIYEGHDEPRRSGGPDPKSVDQPEHTRTGTLTQNGLFAQAARLFKAGDEPPEIVKVYEKVRGGIWVFNGVFRLVDAWREVSGEREVFKFRLELLPWEGVTGEDARPRDLEHARLIPSAVKQEVWKRDGGRCVECGSTDNLHFDHIIPFSRGGSSLTAQNIQLLCARHNIGKRDKIQ